VEPLITQVSNWLFNNDTGDNISKQEFFIVPRTEHVNDKKFLLVFNCLVKKYVWDCKLSYTVPNNDKLKVFIISELRRIFKLDKKFEKIFENCTFYRNLIGDLG
jgi:hypothetical protein